MMLDSNLLAHNYYYNRIPIICGSSSTVADSNSKSEKHVTAVFQWKKSFREADIDNSG